MPSGHVCGVSVHSPNNGPDMFRTVKTNTSKATLRGLVPFSVNVLQELYDKCRDYEDIAMAGEFCLQTVAVVF